MADEPDTSEPNDGGDDSKLELPSLGFRRWRRRRKQQDAAAAEEPSVPEAPPGPAPEPAPEQTPEPPAETTVEAEVPPSAAEPETLAAHPEPEPEPATEAETETQPISAWPEQEPEQEPGPEREQDDHTQVLPSAPEADDPPGHDQEDHDDVPVAARMPRPTTPKKRRKPFTLPPVPAPLATVLTGVLIGLGMVGLTFLSGRGCQAVKGTSSCGAVGVLLLVAIVVLAVMFGAVLLRAWKIADPMNTSFLSVGLVAVITMLFLLGSIDQWWMVIVIPVISALAYLLSWWVTRTFIDPPRADDDAEEPVDVDSVGL
jgi:hypothetical protein